MQHIKTFYQSLDTEEILCTIEGVLVSIPNGSEVFVKEKLYIVRETVDYILDFNVVHRSIWLYEKI